MAERTPFVMAVAGKRAEGLSGWKNRSENAKRRKGRWDDPDRMAIREERARAAAVAAKQAGVEVAPEPVRPAAPQAQEGGDDIAAMKWADLIALYEMTFNEKPGARMKRVDVEARLREGQA